MTLFFTRRTYNASTSKFTNNTAALTRFVQITSGPDSRGRWSGGIISQDDWLRAVQREARTNEVTIFVHGFNNDQSEVLKRLAKIRKGLRANGYRGAVVAFDWPSDGGVFSYDHDRNRVKETAHFLVSDGILPLLRRSPGLKINLIAHSMGAYAVLRGFSVFGDAAGPGAWKVNEIAFASADVDRSWLSKGAWAALLLAHRSKRFTNYYSEKDGVLPISVLQDGFRKRAGRDGLPRLIEKRHVDVNSTDQYLKDVRPGSRSKARSHRWWFDNGTFYRDLAKSFAGTATGSISTRTPGPGSDFTLKG
ncbi:alpha/beta fold hydrolase [uncultured Roseobacter sp.]|uniref:alpha/beta fold hydrolase n=1 Tax=uncultured Roseobacter sp. TaxID=114847 RepID=UPI00260505CE|nr:alpha/beta fold hydrolase [uncultured Roseobacter sp.]